MFRDSAMWTSAMHPPRANLAQTGTAKPTFPSPMTEESIEKTAQRVQSSLRDLGIIARELLKGSRSEEVLSTAARSMVQHEGYIDNCSLNIARLEILSQQIALQ
ncbi:hypothetical protein RvY_04540-2 [Ramazzottius varieornatus]|uniref:BLOC-1-related complex subunit 7 n=1 Tax=Ramazzottius varieornatus TaxID=947166 RepID=A0A1D1V164_RAMVA|nr:hypothetical protein RvY_04540-2 [Ramazzottius varieornatus]